MKKSKFQVHTFNFSRFRILSNRLVFIPKATGAVWNGLCGNDRNVCIGNAVVAWGGRALQQLRLTAGTSPGARADFDRLTFHHARAQLPSWVVLRRHRAQQDKQLPRLTLHSQSAHWGKSSTRVVSFNPRLDGTTSVRFLFCFVQLKLPNPMTFINTSSAFHFWRVITFSLWSLYLINFRIGFHILSIRS